MRETEFKSEYQAQMNTYKAPADLIARTKQAVIAETKKENQKKKNVRYLYGSLATAAALVILFAGVLGFTHMNQGIATMGEDNQIQGTTLYLGEAKTEIYLEEEIEIDRTSVLPMAFRNEDAWIEEIAGNTVRFTLDENGFYIAAYEENDAYMVIYSGMTQIADIKKCVEKILSN